MVASGELRLGNLVLAPELWKDQYFHILELYAGECSISPDVQNQSRIVSYDSLEPIPVSIPLLVGFGFQIREYGLNKVINYIEFRQGKHTFYLSDNLQPIKSPAQPIAITAQKVAYFHQLQNLFFVITGDELSIFASQR